MLVSPAYQYVSPFSPSLSEHPWSFHSEFLPGGAQTSWGICSSIPRLSTPHSSQHRLMRVTPTALLGSWVLQPIKDLMSLRTDFKTHAKWHGYVEEPAVKDFIARGVHPSQIKQSARNPLEREQVPRALGKLSRSCCQTSNNQSLFMSLEIPWGFFAQAVLCWLSRGSCHARKCQFKDITEKKRYDLQLPKGQSHEKPFAKGGMGKENGC
jgi:hypothetical protein